MLGQTEKALGLLRDLLPRYEEAKQETGFVHEEIAECLLALKKPAEAKPHFALAYKQLSRIGWVAEDKPRIERLKRLSGS